MADSKNNGRIASELQQLRGIVLGEYAIEIDDRLADLESKMSKAQTALSGAIKDANNLSASEIQAVRDLIDDRMAKLTADINKQFAAVNKHLSALQDNHVDRTQLGEMLITIGNQLQNQPAE